MSEMPANWWHIDGSVRPHGTVRAAHRVMWYRIERIAHGSTVDWVLLYREHPSLTWHTAFHSPYKRLKDAKKAAWDMDEYKLAWIKSEAASVSKKPKHRHWARCSCGIDLRHE